MIYFIRLLVLIAPLVLLGAYITLQGPTVIASDGKEAIDPFDNDVFPKGVKYLLPPASPILSNPNRSYNKTICLDSNDNEVDYEDVKNGTVRRIDVHCVAAEHVAFGAVDQSEELEQPVHYSHKLHAGELEIQCEYCHTYARRSIHAGIPPVQVCMNCHSDGKVSLENRTEKAQKDLNYIRDHFENDEEIPWVKVHDLPDYVHFTHKRHVKANIQCQECHGEVQADMTVARRVGELTMGWCLNCHESHPSIDKNYCPPDEAITWLRS
jgi:hypothetical protein